MKTYIIIIDEHDDGRRNFTFNMLKGPGPKPVELNKSEELMVAHLIDRELQLEQGSSSVLEGAFTDIKWLNRELETVNAIRDQLAGDVAHLHSEYDALKNKYAELTIEHENLLKDVSSGATEELTSHGSLTEVPADVSPIEASTEEPIPATEPGPVQVTDEVAELEATGEVTETEEPAPVVVALNENGHNPGCACDNCKAIEAAPPTLPDPLAEVEALEPLALDPLPEHHE